MKRLGRRQRLGRAKGEMAEAGSAVGIGGCGSQPLISVFRSVGSSGGNSPLPPERVSSEPASVHSFFSFSSGLLALN